MRTAEDTRGRKPAPIFDPENQRRFFRSTWKPAPFFRSKTGAESKTDMADKIDDDTVAAAMFVAPVENRRRNKSKRNRHVWVQPWVVNRPYHGAYYALIQELHSGDAKGYRNFLRMDADSFILLLDRVSPSITRQNTVMRECVSAEERLAVTLRYLATGVSDFTR